MIKHSSLRDLLRAAAPRVFLFAAALLVTGAAIVGGVAPALAQTTPKLPQDADDARAAERDALLTRLRAAESTAEARGAVDAIWRFWMEPPDREAAARMARALADVRDGAHERALDRLNGVVARWPQWAEAWNQRATVLFALGRDAASLADIERVLDLEPAHFGALAGRGRIHLRQGRLTEARVAIEAAVAIFPLLPERRLLDEPPLAEE